MDEGREVSVLGRLLALEILSNVECGLLFSMGSRPKPGHLSPWSVFMMSDYRVGTGEGILI